MPFLLPNRGFFRFGSFCVDVAQRRLMRGDEVVHLTPKALDVLLALLQDPGQIVDKKELMDSVWGDVAVEEGNLTFTITMLRKALAENGINYPYIENVRGRGYRFTAEVKYEEGVTPKQPLLDVGPQTLNAGKTAPKQRPDRHLARYAWLSLVMVSVSVLLLDVFGIFGGPRLLPDVFIAAIATIGFYRYTRPSTRRSIGIQVSQPQTSAFRGLYPFEASDADRFYGREIDIAALVDRVNHSDYKFSLLHGDSGCGKTSLIRAALAPRIEAMGYWAVYVRSYKDPSEALIEQCRKRSKIAVRQDETELDYLERVSKKAGAGLVIICDQFEEFFIHFPDNRERQPFLELVAACSNQPDLAIKFLFAIRNDFLYLVSSAFDKYILETLLASRRYHLQQFDEEQAQEVIEKSVQRANWKFDSELSRRIAQDLAVHGKILPSELQIVGEQIQSRRIFTLEEYQQAGGKERLMHSYLEDAIRQARDQQAAQLVLRCLISDEDTRLTLPLVEIEKRVQHSPKAIRSVLDLFIRLRLIREMQDEDLWRYELMHEYLIARINQATGKLMDATQRANREFKYHLSSYAINPRVRIPLGSLWRIRRYSDLERGERERELLRKSLRHGLWRTGIFALAVAAVVLGMAAKLSITEEWEGVRLRDGHSAAVHNAVFSPDGRLLVSGGEDGKLIVWDFIRRQRLATLTGHHDWVNVVAFSPNGRWFASGGDDKQVIVWDATSFKAVRVLPATALVGGLTFSPDGTLLAFSSCDNPEEATLWDTAQWRKVKEVPASVNQHSALLFDRADRFLISSASLIITDVTSQKPARESHPELGGNWAALSPDGKELVSLDPYGKVKFIDLVQRRLLAQYKAHQDHGRAVAYSPDGRLVATGAENIVLWDTTTRRKIVRLEYPSIIWSLTFSPDGKWLVSTHGDGSIVVWDPEEHERIADLNEHSGPVRTVSYSRYGKHVASAGEDDTIILWNALRAEKEAVLLGHENKVTGVAFSPDGRFLASTDQDGVTRYWDLAARTPLWQVHGEDPNECVTISHDGRWVATSNNIYSSSTGREVLRVNTNAWSCSFSSDDRSLIYVKGGHFVIIDTQTWQIHDYLKLMSSNSGMVAINFSPDGKMFVTGEDGRAVRLWQLDPLQELGVLGFHSARIKSVAFSPDGQQVASAGDDHMIKLWDVTRRRLIANIGTHSSPVLSIAFSPDGKQLVSGEHDKSVRVYTRHHSLWGWRLD